jgi:hypothetical protein
MLILMRKRQKAGPRIARSRTLGAGYSGDVMLPRWALGPAGQNSGLQYRPNRLIFLLTNPAAASKRGI